MVIERVANKSGQRVTVKRGGASASLWKYYPFDVSALLTYLENLADATIDGSEFTFTGGVINGEKGWYPNVGHYPQMYMRDFAMTVRGRPSKFTAQDLLNALALFVSKQRVDGAFPDGIAPDGDSLAGGGGRYYGYDNTYEWVDVMYQHYLKTNTTAAFEMYQTELALALSYATLDNHLVVLASGDVGFGFQDGVLSEGQELPSSCLRFRAYSQLNEMSVSAGMGLGYAPELELIRTGLEDLWDNEMGLYRNASVTNQEHSIPGNAMAVAFGAAPSGRADTISQYFYNARGNIVANLYQNGMIRHLPGSTHWESHIYGVDTYQDGPFWGTFTGWAATTLHRVSPAQAIQLIQELVTYYQNADQGTVPLEYFLESNSAAGAPRYCASVTLPLEYLMGLS